MNFQILGITLLIFTLVAFGMALGVIFAGKEVKGSCGGLSALFGKGACDTCDKSDQCSDEEKASCDGSATDS